MTPPTTHPREEEAAAYVFGHMDVTERATFARALEADAPLRQITEELSEAAAALALAVPQVAPPPALKGVVLAAAKKTSQEMRIKRAVPVVAKRGGTVGFIGWAAAAAFAVAGFVLWDRLKTSEQLLAASESRLAEAKGWVTKTEALFGEAKAGNEALKASLDHSEKSGRELQLSVAKITEAAAVLKQELAKATFSNKVLEEEKNLVLKSSELDKMQIATLKSTIADYKQGVAVVVWDSARQEGLLKLEKMPPLDANKDYQLWVVDPSKKTPVNAGVVRVDPKGFAKVQFKPTTDIQQADKFALSVEKKVEDPAGVPVGAGPIVLLSP
ncbi:MAG: hypothetical protein JWO94_1433 [Verrucomicrobiaceae bacterium]|nr:hypothetical protein [Verrucomicrobiaceae bacterium]